MRAWFGGDLAAWTFTVGEQITVGALQGRMALAVGGISVTFYNAPVGGSRYTDLLDAEGGSITHVLSSTGDNGYGYAQIPRLQGPHEVTDMWAQAGDGPRSLITATDAAAVAYRTAGDLHAHRSSPDPHKGLYVATAGGSDIRLPDGDTNTTGLRIWVPAGVRDANAFEALCNVGTPEAPDWRPGTVVSSYGQLWVQAVAPNMVPLKVVQRSTAQSADLQQWGTADDTRLAWVAANGTIRAPNLGRSIPFTKQGPLTAAAGTYRWYNDTGTTLRIRSVRGYVVDAPTGRNLILDVHRNATTIFTDQTNRPTIPAGGTGTGKITTMDVATITDGQYLTVDIDQIGSTNPGSDLVVQIEVA